MPSLEFAFIADAAEAQPGRKFYVLGGGIDTIGAQRFPVVHPHMSLVLRIAVDATEVDAQHRLDIRLIDADGRELLRLDGQFAAHGPAPVGRQIAMPLVMNMVNTRFETPGDYAIEIMIDGAHAKSLPLRLQQVGAPPSG